MRTRWWIDLALLLVFWYAIIISMSVAIGSGAMWQVLSGRLAQTENYSFQSDLLELKQRATSEILVLGDTMFSSTTSALLHEASIESVAVDAPRVQLKDLLVPLPILCNERWRVIVIQNSPHLWTNVNFQFSQNLDLWSYLHKKKSIYEYDYRASVLFWSLLKDYVTVPRTVDVARRPESLRNASALFPPSRNASQWTKLLRSAVGSHVQLLWVTDARGLAADASPDVRERFVRHFTQDTTAPPGMRFITMEELVPTLDAFRAR